MSKEIIQKFVDIIKKDKDSVGFILYEPGMLTPTTRTYVISSKIHNVKLAVVLDMLEKQDYRDFGLSEFDLIGLSELLKKKNYFGINKWNIYFYNSFCLCFVYKKKIHRSGLNALGNIGSQPFPGFFFHKQLIVSLGVSHSFTTSNSGGFIPSLKKPRQSFGSRSSRKQNNFSL